MVGASVCDGVDDEDEAVVEVHDKVSADKVKPSAHPVQTPRLLQPAQLSTSVAQQVFWH